MSGCPLLRLLCVAPGGLIKKSRLASLQLQRLTDDVSDSKVLANTRAKPTLRVDNVCLKAYTRLSIHQKRPRPVQSFVSLIITNPMFVSQNIVMLSNDLIAKGSHCNAHAVAVLSSNGDSRFLSSLVMNGDSLCTIPAGRSTHSGCCCCCC